MKHHTSSFRLTVPGRVCCSDVGLGLCGGQVQIVLEVVVPSLVEPRVPKTLQDY